MAQLQLICSQHHTARPLPHQHAQHRLVTEHLYFGNARDGRQRSQHVEVGPLGLAGAEDGVILGKVEVSVKQKEVFKKSRVMQRKRSILVYHCTSSDKTAGKHTEKHLCRPHGKSQSVSGSLISSRQLVATNKVWWAEPSTGDSN